MCSSDLDYKELIPCCTGMTDFEAVLAPTEGDNIDDRQEAE